MTRSEKLQEVIRLAKNGVEYTPQSDKTRELNAFALELFLAEQKRSEGCAYCAGNALDDYGLENMNGKYPKVLTRLEVANGHGTNQHGFSFCPNCGRSLTDGESV